MPCISKKCPYWTSFGEGCRGFLGDCPDLEDKVRADLEYDEVKERTIVVKKEIKMPRINNKREDIEHLLDLEVFEFQQTTMEEEVDASSPELDDVSTPYIPTVRFSSQTGWIGGHKLA
jgi:hypothetical protein